MTSNHPYKPFSVPPPSPISGVSTSDKTCNGKYGIDSVRTIKIFDASMSDCPVEVWDEVVRMWNAENLGGMNNYYTAMTDIVDYHPNITFAEKYPLIAWWLAEKGHPADVNISIHHDC